jgi:hypothetical protein
MKPSSLVTIILRLTAIYFVIYGTVTSFIPVLAAMIFRQNTGLATPIGGEIPGFVSGIFGLQLAAASILIFIGIFLYIWSGALGRLVARGVEE